MINIWKYLEIFGNIIKLKMQVETYLNIMHNNDYDICKESCIYGQSKIYIVS